MSLTVTIVRHGNTFGIGEPARRIGARTDLPLVESGREQGRALGAAFAGKGLRFDRALTAPLLRSRETMALILAELPEPPLVETTDWLTEIDHGPDEGQFESAVMARLGAPALAAWDAAAVVPDGWLVDADRRVQAWRALFESGNGQVLVVTSNGAARFALHCDGALRAAAVNLPSLKLRTGAYGVIARERDMLRVVAWDCRP